MRVIFITLFALTSAVTGRGDDTSRLPPAVPLPEIPVPPQQLAGTPVETSWKRAVSDSVQLTRDEGVPRIGQADKDQSPPSTAAGGKSGADAILEELTKRLNARQGGTNADAGSERARLQEQINELIKKLQQQKAAKPSPRLATPPEKSAGPAPLDKASIVDPLRYGIAMYRENDPKSALTAFRLIDPNTRSKEDQAFIRYLMACCYRRLGQVDEAVQVFQEVADSRADELLTECALWQISSIREARVIDAQLKKLSGRQKK